MFSNEPNLHDFFEINWSDIDTDDSLEGGHKLVPVEDENDLNIFACYDRNINIYNLDLLVVGNNLEISGTRNMTIGL